MKRLFWLVTAALLIALAVPQGPALAGGTGTFDITNYTITITPQSDGTLVADYSLTWFVNTGYADWITVGMPNRDYSVTGWAGNATSVSSANQGSWSGVRVDLDKAYQPGESFTAQFTVRLNQMAYANGADQISYQFTPGWYDDIPTRELVIRWNTGPDVVPASVKPDPTNTGDGYLEWRTNLSPGNKFTIELLFAQAVFPDYTAPPAPVDSGEGVAGTGLPLWLCIIAAVILVIIVILLVAYVSDDSYGGGGYIGGSGGSSSSHRSSGGGSIFTGGGSSSSSRSSRSGGGSSDFGGRSSSCACACVSCACACACAGGSGAGCAAKGYDTEALLEHLEKEA